LLTDVSEERIASIFRVTVLRLTKVKRPCYWISYTLKMETTRSSETSVNKISTLRHIPEEAFFIVTEVKTSNLTINIAFVKK
jgi:hypothetical protein